ncbi:cytosolic phospholipase A2 gamma-like isoform X2 [Hippoglossus stenolepis]|uniref:cytosolic phospholipase A2 gamma-like isoform X2 n=1 Tax=Hippoglossus stenolepis TaxID=195615 RepID=UPI001FAEE91A|nr:cytosolic phospholipase A2 gamma-like isoform X2 [Hippoglossus stenolepis]
MKMSTEDERKREREKAVAWLFNGRGENRGTETEECRERGMATIQLRQKRILGALAEAADNMEVKEAASVKPIDQSPSLCAGEQDYVDRRKRVVLESLNSLGINCSADWVPHIALLPSGGGQRAAVGLMGSLSQMEKDGLLDPLLYIGGVSGSTWSMSALYSDPQWSGNMDRAVSTMTGPGVELEQALAWLDKRSKEELFSLSDIWGVLTSVGIMKQMDLRHLSDEASRNATNPYPIYSTIEKGCLLDGPTEGKWFEVSPHEAGFTELGVFVETSLLGSKFQSGELQEQKTEMDMIELQGVLGCALAHDEVIREFIPPWLNDSDADEYLRVYNTLDKLVALIRSSTKDPTTLSELNTLQKILEDKVNCNDSALLESKNMEERKKMFHHLSLKLLEAVDTWSQRLGNASVIPKQVLPLIMKWEWGTTRNFLYQHEDAPPCLGVKEIIHLVDAGLLINVAYPPFLGEKRDIDLIIVLEYSAGNMFETLTLARDYAAEVKKPFPEIDDQVLEEREWPMDCYVFEGKEKEPTIVYMPLFNRRNCQDAKEVDAKMEEFSTFQPPFSEAKIKFMLETAEANMKNNKELLLREINKAVLRRQNKRKSVLNNP